MKRSEVQYLFSYLNYLSAMNNFIFMVRNVNADNDYAFVNMFFVFFNLIIGTMLLLMANDNRATGN